MTAHIFISFARSDGRNLLNIWKKTFKPQVPPHGLITAILVNIETSPLNLSRRLSKQQL